MQRALPPQARVVSPALHGVATRCVSLVCLTAAMGWTAAAGAAEVAVADLALEPVKVAAPVRSEAEAEALLTLPTGTISMGDTGRGRLVSGRAMRIRGAHYAFFPHIAERGMQHGTDEMQGLLQRASEAVARQYRHSLLRVGNIALQVGGRSQWHASHQTGRDVDFAFYVTDAKGQPQDTDNYVKLNRRGRSADGAWFFDDARNLALVTAMVQDERAPVQWIFVYKWLKKRLIARAERDGLDAELIRRLNEVMRQPSDSAPHDDHFHVRIYCSLQDRSYGCLNREPYRDWVDMQDDAWEQHVSRVASVLDLESAALRLRAVALLETIRATPAVPRLVEGLGDESTDVRRAALQAIETIADPVAGPGLLRHMATVQDADWAMSIFEVYQALRPDDMAAVARRMILQPATLLHAKVVRHGLGPLQVAAAEILAVGGGKADVPALLSLLSSRAPEARQAAHDALSIVTNQRIRGNPASRSAKEYKRVARSWHGFWRKSSGQSWLQWMRTGFRSHGVRLSKGALSQQDLPRLVRAIRHANPVVSENARRVLTHLTGHEYRPPSRDRRQEVRRVYTHWRWWTRRHARHLRLTQG